MIKIYKEPDLKNSYLIAGFPGPGGVGLGVASYLNRLGAEKFCEIEAYKFSSMPRSVIKGGVMEELEFLDNEFSYWKSKGENDLIIFKSEQPTFKKHEFINLALDVAEKFRVKRVYTSSGLIRPVRHTKEPWIFAAANKPELKEYLENFNLLPIKTGIGLTDLNAVLVGSARERNIEGVCLFSEVPVYVAPLPNPKGVKSILKLLSKMLSIDIDLVELDRFIKQMDQEMEKLYENLPEDTKKTFVESVESEAKLISDLTEAEIENLFMEAEKDPSEFRISKLGTKLYSSGLFPKYEDRFFKLIQKKGEYET